MPGLKISRLFLIISMVFVFSAGCVSHITELREAQKEFNQAASLENQLRLAPFRSDAVIIKGQADASYLLSLKILDNLLEKKKDALVQDRLIGTAYTLKALAEWRLKRYSDALETANTVTENHKDSLFPRDRALIKALRGLIKNDQAYIHMMKRDYSYEKILYLLRDAINDIQDAIAITPSEHDLRVYFIISELAVLKNWKDLRGEPGYSSLRPEGFDFRKELKKWCEAAEPVWSELVKEMEGVDGSDAERMKNWWAKRLSMPQACK